MTGRTWHIAALLLTTAGCLWPSEVRARGLLLITRGETISHVGDVPLAVQQRHAGLPSTGVGFKYSYAGVFWLDLWTWGGNYCLYKERKFWQLTPEQAAQLLDRPVSELSAPLAYTFPLGLVILMALCVLGVLAKLLQRLVPNPLRAVLADDRYREALEVFQAQLARAQAAPPAVPDSPRAVGTIPAAPDSPSAPPDAATDDARRQEQLGAAYEAAVTHLTKFGIERAEAEEKLSLLLTAAPPPMPASAATGPAPAAG
jgi:hypothetical protein